MQEGHERDGDRESKENWVEEENVRALPRELSLRAAAAARVYQSSIRMRPQELCQLHFDDELMSKYHMVAPKYLHTFLLCN